MSGSLVRLARCVIATATLAVLTAHIAAAQSDTKYRTSPCQDSLLFLAASLTCITDDGSGETNRLAISTLHSTAGRLNDSSLNMTLSMSGSRTYFSAYGEDASVRQIKSYASASREPVSGWSQIKTTGNTSYMTFTAGKQSCIGFDHSGPLQHGGYEWLLRGFVCLPPGQIASFEVLKPYLAAIRIGAAPQNRNAFGQPVEPMPSAPARSSIPDLKPASPS
jgi:hypothetical protein